ncbi:MAG: polysaccharide deacetylase family protein [Chloroflexi bacterium]|nr:polysaccharide deacetylase family protein [Chloroflexota bacterium]
MERDFVGYADSPPMVTWPNGARLAVQVCVNYEEGAEYSLLDGPRRETMGEVPSPVPQELRDLFNESFFEYGSRVGVWRILRILKQYHVPATWWMCAQALARNPRLAQVLAETGDEVGGHGYRWEEFHATSPEAEMDNIHRTVDTIVRLTGQRPLGWFTRYACSPNTRALLMEEGGFLYDSLGLNDDLPYYVQVKGKPWLVVPYTFEVNDARFWRGGLVSVDDFYEYMRGAFDCLYGESATVPKMMSLGLHCRIGGTPARSQALARFLEYARGFSDVWFARRVDVARWWLQHNPPPAE